MNFTAWDVTLTLAVLIQITKASDLLLRKHQQDWVNRFCDSVALKLDEIKPLTWFRMVRSRLVQKVLVGLTIILFALINTFGFLGAFVRVGDDNDYGWLIIISGVVSIIGNIFVLFKWGPNVVDDIFFEDRFSAFLKTWGRFCWSKYRVLLPVGLFLNWVVPFLFFGALGSNLGSWLIVSIPALAFSIYQSLAFMGVMSGLMVIFAQLILYCLSILVVIFRAIVWRVVEYNKGAWAALTLIVTVALGVFDVYMRATNKA
jgi:hypothetical protein